MFTSAVVLLRDFLSLSVISICFFSKLPQIVTAVKSESVKGISVNSLFMEIVRIYLLLTYNFCSGHQILMYLEQPVTLIQQAILCYLVLTRDNQMTVKIVLSSLLLCLTGVMFMVGLLPLRLLESLVILCPVFNILSRFTQVFRIIRHKNANGISLLSWSLSFYNSFARLCTLLMGSDNTTLLLNSIASVSGNLSVIICSVYYQDKIKIQKVP